MGLPSCSSVGLIVADGIKEGIGDWGLGGMIGGAGGSGVGEQKADR